MRNLKELCRQFIEHKISGVFLAPTELESGQEKANRHLAESLREAGIPVVLIDRDMLDFPGCSEFDLVGLDNMTSGYMLAEHLIKLGCKRFYFVARPLSAATVDAQISGVREALARHRIEPDPGWVRTGDPVDMKFNGLTPSVPSAQSLTRRRTRPLIRKLANVKKDNHCEDG